MTRTGMKTGYGQIALPAEPPSRIQLTSWGTWIANGTPYLIDEETKKAIDAQLAADPIDLVIDYQHGTEGGEFAPANGKAVAAGWMKKIEVIPGGGIFADVEWTPDAAEHIRKREYRYISPAWDYRESDNKVLALRSAGLTNTPGWRTQQALATLQPDSIGDSAWESLRYTFGLPVTATYREILMQMEEFLKRARAELGLAESADMAAVLSALSARNAAHTALRSAVCSAARVDAKTADTELVTRVAALAPVPAGGDALQAQIAALQASHKQTAEELATARATIATLQQTQTAAAAESRIHTAIDEGKLTEAMLKPDAKGENFYRGMACKKAEWESWNATAPVIASPAGTLVAGHGAPTLPETTRDRAGLIASASAAFDREKTSKRVLCTRAAWINNTLREADQNALSADEAAKAGA